MTNVTNVTTLPDAESLLNIDEVRALVGNVSAMTIRLWCKKGQFPPPTKFGRLARWHLRDIKSFVRARKSGEQKIKATAAAWLRGHEQRLRMLGAAMLPAPAPEPPKRGRGRPRTAKPPPLKPKPGKRAPVARRQRAL